jgi:enoyl-CoA hydratase/carnithine racemase
MEFHRENVMSDLIVSDDGPVRTLRMNRLAKKNALTLAMYDAMAAAIEDAATNDAIRCLLIAGGPGAFCAGNDIGDFMQAPDAAGAPGGPTLRFLYSLVRCEKPLVAAVAGAAIGVGTTMLLHCDHVVAAVDARFSTPFVALGLTPEAGSSLIAPRLMGHGNAFALLVMGRPLDAGQAKALGIVSTVVPAADVEAEAMKAAREISALPPECVRASRRLLRGSAEEIIARIDSEAAEFRVRLKSPEARAAFAGFLARKR